LDIRGKKPIYGFQVVPPKKRWNNLKSRNRGFSLGLEGTENHGGNHRIIKVEGGRETNLLDGGRILVDLLP